MARETLCRLLGRGTGRFLEIGCGGGVLIPSVAAMGWSVVGVDVSADQLRVAEQRAGDVADSLVLADAANLPFADSSFDAAASAFIHTDVDDVAPVFAEAARVLRRRGRFVYVGTHPCFVSPFVENAGDRRVIHEGYRRAEWHMEGPGLGEGIRSRVGVRHVPLAEFVNAVISSGLTLVHVEESGSDDPPQLLAFSAVL